MIEGKFYADKFRKNCKSLEKEGFHLGVGDKYLLRKLSQEYAYHCLREDFKEIEGMEKMWENIISYGKITRRDFIIADEGLDSARRTFQQDYFYESINLI
jgi:hypothetical protein